MISIAYRCFSLAGIYFSASRYKGYFLWQYGAMAVVAIGLLSLMGSFFFL